MEEKSKSRFNVYLKIIKTEAVFTKKWAMSKINVLNVRGIFQRNIPLTFNTFIPLHFLLVKAPLKLLFLYNVKLCHYFSFDIIHVIKSFLMNFQFKKEEKNHTVLNLGNMAVDAFAQHYDSSKTATQIEQSILVHSHRESATDLLTTRLAMNNTQHLGNGAKLPTLVMIWHTGRYLWWITYAPFVKKDYEPHFDLERFDLENDFNNSANKTEMLDKKTMSHTLI